jgi:cysteine desulfurase/selenocysteine lyase
VYGPKNSEDRTSIVSFTIKGKEPETVVKKLEKLGIVLAVREIYDKKIIRASPHFFNTESEILRVIDALKGL